MGMKRIPKTILATALLHEKNNFGSLWFAFEEPRTFEENELSFIHSLADQVALAAANTYRFMNVVVGNQRLETILSSTLDAIFILSERKKLILANQAAREILGISAEAELETPIEEMVAEQELLDFLMLPDGGMVSREIHLSDERVFLTTGTPIESGDRRAGMLYVMRDVTHYIEIDEMKSEYVSVVSHDLRSPLIQMQGYVTMLETVGDLNELQVDYLRKIEMSIANLTKFINNLLDLRRIDTQAGLQYEKFQVTDIIHQVVDGYKVRAAQRKVRMKVAVSKPSMPEIDADRALLSQALSNLVDNAIKFTGSGGEVEVGAEQRSEGIVIFVRDTGVGIAPVDQEQLFDQFTQFSKREGREDKGLGLTIVKSIIERHKGRIWVESELGKGSIFYVLLPFNSHGVMAA